MARIGLKSKGARRDSSSTSLACKECNKMVHNVDSQADFVTCPKCVSRSLNPHTIFVEDLSPAEWTALVKKHS